MTQLIGLTYKYLGNLSKDFVSLQNSYIFENLFPVTGKLFPVSKSINRAVSKEVGHSLFTSQRVNISKDSEKSLRNSKQQLLDSGMII